MLHIFKHRIVRFVSAFVLAGLIVFAPQSVRANGETGHSFILYKGKTIDSFPVVVTQNSKYLMPGQEIVISVIACSNSEQIREININGARVNLNKDNIAEMIFSGGPPGFHSIPVSVFYRDNNQELQVKKFEITYEVGQANAVIDASKLNLFYIGIDNPLGVYPSENGIQQVDIAGGGTSLVKTGPGQYIVRADSITAQCVVAVSLNGRFAGAKRFHVLHLPMPTASIGKYISGEKLPASVFTSENLQVSLDNFPFAVDYKISGYTITVIEKGMEVAGFKGSNAALPAEFKNQLSQLKPGTMVIIDNIVVHEPGNRQLTLPALVYYIK